MLDVRKATFWKVAYLLFKTSLKRLFVRRNCKLTNINGFLTLLESGLKIISFVGLLDKYSNNFGNGTKIAKLTFVGENAFICCKW